MPHHRYAKLTFNVMPRSAPRRSAKPHLAIALQPMWEEELRLWIVMRYADFNPRSASPVAAAGGPRIDGRRLFVAGRFSLPARSKTDHRNRSLLEPLFHPVLLRVNRRARFSTLLELTTARRDGGRR